MHAHRCALFSYQNDHLTMSHDVTFSWLAMRSAAITFDVHEFVRTLQVRVQLKKGLPHQLN